MYRTLNDCDQMIEYVKSGKAKTASVVGGGLLGLEVAEALLGLGVDVITTTLTLIYLFLP